VLLGTLTVGVLDILDAFVFFGVRNGVSPVRILHSIAAGLLGREAARGGGIPTAVLGAFLHFFIAFVVVAVYVFASRRLPVLARRPLLFGALYGLTVYAVMNYVVLPLSATEGPAGLPPLPVLGNGLLIHMLGVGIPSALFARVAADAGPASREEVPGTCSSGPSPPTS
jgi:hypothetical protein